MPFSLFFEDCSECQKVGDVECLISAQRSAEGFAMQCGGQALGGGMDPRAPARMPSRGIHYDPSVARDDPHK